MEATALPGWNRIRRAVGYWGYSRLAETHCLEIMMRKIICLTFLALPFAAMAGVCETAWDGDKIISSLSGRSSELRIPLKNQNQATNEITLGQLQVFHEAKDRISRVVGISPKFVVCGDSEPNAFAISGPSGEVVAVSIGMLNIANGDRDMAAAGIGVSSGCKLIQGSD